jgi:hypothetical protein
MSLSRDEWEELWEIVKGMERDADYLEFRRKDVADRIRRQCERAKTLIQSVIGQME